MQDKQRRKQASFGLEEADAVAPGQGTSPTPTHRDKVKKNPAKLNLCTSSSNSLLFSVLQLKMNMLGANLSKY